jgi:ATP-binding cassette, subfamily B, bacterial
MQIIRSFRRRAHTPSSNKDTGQTADDALTPRKIISAFISLPRVLRLVWDIHAGLTLSLGILNILQGFTPAAQVWIAGQLINSIISAVVSHGQHGTTGIVIGFVIAQFGIQILNDLLMTLSNICQQLLQEQTANSIQAMVMEKANTLDLQFFEDAQFYDKLRQAQQEATTRPTGMISQTFGLGRTLITVFSLVAILINLAWWIALLALLAPIPSFIASMKYGWWGYQMMRRQSPLRREMLYYNNLLTTDTYNKEIKLFTLGSFFTGQYWRLANQFFAQAKSIIVPRYLASFFWGTLTLLVTGGIYLYVALLAVAGRISIGAVTQFTQAVISLGTSFENLLSGISSTYENNLFINTLFEFLEYQPKIVSPPNGLPAPTDGMTVEFQHVSFTYPGRENQGPVLRDISFTISAGEAIALVGHNGAGKTTIVKLLTRLYDPDEGAILINGINIKEYDLESLRKQIGVIFQDYVTYYLSAGHNIGVGRVDDVDDLPGIQKAAAKSGANAVIEKLPEAYDTMLGKQFEKGQQLSGGEWQKIALARAFMRDAQLLTLDEPTSSLDPQAEYDVFARFRELTVGKSAIFISHRFSTVRLANRIIVLEQGTVLEEGTHAELLARNGRYAELFNLQAEAYR